jgi:hypothetical protein
MNAQLRSYNDFPELKNPCPKHQQSSRISRQTPIVITGIAMDNELFKLKKQLRWFSAAPY